MTDRRWADPGRPAAESPEDAEIGLVLAQIVRSDVAAPVDTARLTGAAIAGAVRIRHRRATLTAAAAAVLLAVPGTLAGLHLGLGQPGGPPVVAAGGPGAATSSSPPSGVDAVGPTAPSPTTSLGTVRFTAKGGQSVVASFTTRTRTLDATTATTSYPAVTVTGGPPAVRRAVQTALEHRIASLVQAYEQRVDSLRAADSSPVQSIEVRATTTWRHTVTIIFESDEEIPGALPRTVTAPVVLDTRSGAAVNAEALLTDVSAADALARKAVTATMPPGAVQPARLAKLTMRRDPGRTAETVAWYPTSEGITWVVDTDGSTVDVPDPVTATIPWTSLAGLLREPPPR